MTEHGGPPPGVGDLFWPVLNFALFAWLVTRFLGAGIREYFRARTERLRDELAAGVRARAEAEALRGRLTRDVADLPALRERLRSDLRAAAERVQEELLAGGRAAAARIRQDARLVAEQELAAAGATLRAELIDEAVRRAVELIRGVTRPEDQERFVREFVAAAGTPQ